MEQKPIIEIKNLKKRYRMGSIGSTTLRADWESFWAKIRGKEDPNTIIGEERLKGQTFMALNGINLTVMPGEAVGVIGVNGAGKSTMLKLISRITAPTEGSITLRGKVASMLEVGTGFNPELTGRENVYMNGTILGMKKEEIDTKMDQIIEFSECRDFIDTPVKRYSSGMYVKLAFSVAAHLDSDIMIMDEVLAVGDAKFQKKCLGKMSEAATTEGKTILYVSHNMSTIRQLCTRCVVLKEGRVIFDGDVEEAIRVYSDESFNFSLSQRFKQSSQAPSFQYAVLKGIDILDKDNLIYTAEEKFRMRILYDCLHDCSEEIIRCTIKYAGANTIGTHLSEKFSIHKGSDRSIEIEMDLSTITPGKYFCDLSMATIDTERLILHDDINNAFGFEIIENKSQCGLRWSSGRWGYHALKPITITQDSNV